MAARHPTPRDLPPPVSVRLFKPADHDAVVRVWELGFAELAPHVYTNIASRPHFIVAAAIGAACWAAGLRTPAYITAAWLAVVFTPPIGRTLLTLLLWRGIKKQGREDMTPEMIREKWSVPGESAFFVAEEGGTHRILGCAAVTRHHTLYKEATAAGRAAAALPSALREASVWRVSVDGAARGRGVGRLLMEAIDTWAAANGIVRLSLVCGNPESKQFYRALGYRSEDLEHAMTAALGVPTSLQLTSLADRFRAWRLGSRMGMGNILAKELVAPVPSKLNRRRQ